MRILHLTLKRHWWEMIASGDKKEEYRQWKEYWLSRLIEFGVIDIEFPYNNDRPKWKRFDIVRFKNGYGKSAPTMDIEFKGIRFGNGKAKWGWTEKCIIIKLGKIISIKNYDRSKQRTNPTC